MHTKEDYITSLKPFEELYEYIGDPFEHERRLSVMTEEAKSVGIKNFRKLYTEYVRSMRRLQQSDYISNVTRFTGQPIQLATGNWEADDNGVITHKGGQEQQACCHPILPIERLTNVDTGNEKLKLAYCKGNHWRTEIADKRTLASSNSITRLAEKGIAVNSENAKYLVQYLHDIENLNYARIPEKKSINRLGWIDGQGFSPYVTNLAFDGDDNYKSFFESVSTKGSRETWFDLARVIRQGTVTGRIMLAASFASVLVKPLNCLPFFVHLWGNTEVGKTVALMLAASVWATPEIGRFIHTFNSTVVGREKSAAFVNSLPLILDELQVANSDSKKQFDHDIYALTEGAGRTRGTRTGGIEKTPTWATCILSCGEDPITSSNSGGGAINRILEVECQREVFSDCVLVANTIQKHYGHVGREFVMRLQDEQNMDKARRLFNRHFSELKHSDTTEKQSMSAAIVLTADSLIDEWLFHDSATLTAKDMEEFLRTKEAVNVNERAYRFVCDWVSQNANRLRGSSDETDVWGEISGDFVYIIRSRFIRIVKQEGFNPTALLSWLKQKNLILIRGKNNTRGRRINGINTECVVLLLPGTGAARGQNP